MDSLENSLPYLQGLFFYNKHEIIEDAAKGLFDRGAAEKLVNLQESGSDTTGNPHMVHIFGTTVESITNYIDFIAEVSDSPFLIDSPEDCTCPCSRICK